MSSLRGQKALIIGAMNTLAADAAVGLQEAGAELVLLHSATETAAAEDLLLRLVGKGARPRAASANFATQEEAAAALKPFARVDVAILSPSWHAHAAFLDLTPDAADAALRTNVEEMTYALQALLKKMMAEGGGGSILLLSSVHTLWPAERTTLLVTSLATMHVIAQMAAVEAAGHGITVNIVAAGWRRSADTEAILASAGDAVIGAIPAGRLAAAQDLGAACAFLASPEASYITGAILPVDGGYLLTKSEGENPFLR